MTIHLRQYQLDALDAEARHRAEHPDETRLAIVMPTGTGKSFTMAERACRFLREVPDADTRGDRWSSPSVLVLVHTDELTDQMERSMRLLAKPWNFSVGVVKAGRDETDADIIVGSVQTLARPERRARITDIGLVLVDECELAYAPSWQEVLRHFGCFGYCPTPRCECGGMGCTEDAPRIPALGFTATLERGDGAGLGDLWQNVAYTRDISWAVRKGYLVQPIGYRLEIDVADLGRGDRSVVDRWTMAADTLDTQICDSIAPERIVEKWIELANGRQTVVFAPLVRSARRIRDAFREADVTVGPVELIHGAMPDAERRRIVEAFRAGRIQVLCNAMVLTRGFDHPGIGCVIVARPTKSRGLFIQMAGRGLRPVPGVPVEEQDCILITLADGTADLCSVADLSSRPGLDRKADGPLTVMEDQWDIGKDLEDAARHWTGRVDATRFDPIVASRSKVWACTKGGHWFLPISKDREYVFLVDTSIYVLTREGTGFSSARVARAECVHADLGDLELAFSLAEDEATERGGDIGALLADRTRAWRSEKPKPDSKMLAYAVRLGLSGEVDRIMSAGAGGKAGKISDLIRRVEASRSIDKMADKIRERLAAK